MSDMSESFLDFDPPPVSDSWQPRDDNEANWAIGRLKLAQARLDHHKAERAKAIEKWDAYVEMASRQAVRDEQFFTAKLHGYLLSLREAGKLGDKKSYRLPDGILKLRSVKAKYEVQDKVYVLGWAEISGALTVKIEPDMDKIRQACADGVDVPGMIMTRQAGESFSVQLVDNINGGGNA